MAIITDIIDGEFRETSQGYATTRAFIISDVSGNGHARLYNALLTSGVPQRGDTHPTLADLTVDERTARPEGKNNTIVRVTISYTDEDGGDGTGEGDTRISLGAGLTTERTNRDAYGDPIVTTYTLVEYDTAGATVGTQVVNYLHAVDVQRPSLIYRVTTTLDYSPTELAEEYTGRIGSWTPGRFDWQCTGITSDTTSGGDSYETTFEFQKAVNPEIGWQAVVEEVDPTTGQPRVGGAVHLFDVYQVATFADLPIPAP